MKKILVVDDFEKSLFITDSLLKKAGYQTIAAHNANEALTALKKQSFDLLVTDLNMPGKTGIELTKLVRENPVTTRMPVIMLTTEISPKLKRDAANAGITTWLQKPFDAENFLKTVKALIER